ncbi:MAG: hypothetical protein A2840_02685 [Candidatus Buchananbacteria bacterium RIFCSPHIGHO2_01_FULL_47_11b]|uniref:DUF218 domain-containing protein n=1 Tax=Candidatus Buchananbacteria bacterium RIFCSPHIGHO2_01_FULL_47_11b TaxID=1797537 RepID=A0A1G1Y3G7_9BACT|nr:MAG: hypothetical protein A2840_02685 [Candidatus Buchananbacteria bacterium RIFCSPHIGHO2_01_FULL_47_11b]
MNTQSKKIISVFPAGIKKNTKQHWVSTDLTEADTTLGAPGGRLRSLAAAVLFAAEPESLVVAHGDRGWEIDQDFASRPSLAEILKAELVTAGVPAEKILKEEKSNRTYEHLLELVSLSKEMNIESITIVTNLYHSARVAAMIEHIPDLQSLQHLPITVVSAEDILVEDSPDDWQEQIEQFYTSEAVEKIIESERTGVENLRNGTYQFK